MTVNDSDLLGEYLAHNSEKAFAELVSRHLNLVYSAALRQVRSPQLAEEVAQSVFTDLSRNARKLKPDTILTAWLYQVTRRTAIDVVRRESRRQARERLAVEMAPMNTTDLSRRNPMQADDWTHIEPFLDEAMAALDETERAAVLLRYFENKSLREVGEQFGVSDDAAQKRVSRAVERLREFLAKRGVTVGAGGLAVLITANAVQAAPVGLAATVAGTTFTAAVIKAATFTTLQKAVIAATLAVAVGGGLYTVLQNSTRQLPAISSIQSAGTFGQRFVEITGEIQLFDYVRPANGGAVQRKTASVFPFKCIVGTNEWRIEDGFMIGAREDWYFDGTNVYQSFTVTNSNTNIQVPPPAAVAQGPVTVGFSASNLTVRIIPSPGGYPVGHLGAQLPWLAFCSGPYLKREGRVVPLPTAIARMSADSFAYTDKTQAFKDEFGLPSSLWLYTSREQFKRGLLDARMAKTGPAQRARLNPSPGPYPDGILKYRYEVVSSTNFAGWTFPREFAYTEYEADRQGRWDPHTAGVGKINSIRESPARPQNVLDSSMRQTIFDFRFRHPLKLVDGIIYQWQKNVVPGMDEPALQAEYSDVVKRAQDDPAAKIKFVP